MERYDGWRYEVLERYASWMRYRGFSEATLRRRLCTIRLYLAAFPDPREVTAVQIEDWLAGRKVCASSRRDYLGDVRSFYEFATSRGLVPSSPAKEVLAPKVGRRLPRPVPVADLETAIATGRGWVRRAVMLGWMAGLRASEASALHIRDVYDGQIHVLHGKGNRDRSIPLHPRLEAELIPLKGRVCGVNAGSVSFGVAEHFRSLGMPWTMHNARHTFGTLTYRASGDLLMTRDLLGHSSVQTTEGYSAADMSRAAEIVGRVA